MRFCHRQGWLGWEISAQSRAVHTSWQEVVCRQRDSLRAVQSASSSGRAPSRGAYARRRVAFRARQAGIGFQGIPCIPDPEYQFAFASFKQKKSVTAIFFFFFTLRFARCRPQADVHSVCPLAYAHRMGVLRSRHMRSPGVENLPARPATSKAEAHREADARARRAPSSRDPQRN